MPLDVSDEIWLVKVGFSDHRKTASTEDALNDDQGDSFDLPLFGEVTM